MDAYRIVKEVGSGAFGRVVLVEETGRGDAPDVAASLAVGERPCAKFVIKQARASRSLPAALPPASRPPHVCTRASRATGRLSPRAARRGGADGRGWERRRARTG